MLSRQLALGVTLAQGASLPADAVSLQARPSSGHEDSNRGLDEGHLEALLRSLIAEVRSAESPEDLDWRLSEQVAGGPLEEFYAAALALLPHVPEQELQLDPLQLDERIRQVVPLFLLSTQLAVALLTTIAAEQGADDEGAQLEGVLADLLTRLDLQDILYGEGLPPRVQEALYGGQVSYLCLLTLLDDTRAPSWLEEELHKRTVEGQHEYVRLLVAFAREAGVPVPESPILAALEPFDLDAADRHGERQRGAVASYLRSVRTSRGAG